MKSQNNIKRFPAVLLLLATFVLALPMATPALATVNSVTINSPTAASPAYIRTIGTEPERTVVVDYTVVFNNMTETWRRHLILMQGSGSDYEVSPGQENQPVPSALSETQTVSLVAQADTPEGLYNVRVNAKQPRTGSGGTNADNTNAVMVDNTAPTSAILMPSDGDTICVGTLVSITGTADDPISGGVTSGIASVEVTVDSTSLTVTGTTSWSTEWTPDTPGIYTITPVATDNAGNVQSTDTSILVEVVECEECEWKGETAWADGDPYNVDGGNWATYTPYLGEELEDVMLYAGQTLEAGTVDFSAPAGGYVTITITVNTGFRFLDDPENVKIQDYEEAPSGNPSLGQFDSKDHATGSSFSIDVPENNFYGVHVDVEVCE